MPSGSYDRLVQFERAAVRDNGLQRVRDGWASLGPEVPARMEPGAGSERFANAENAATAPAVYRFLYHPELASLVAADRLRDGGRVLAIKSVRWDGRLNSEVEVLAIVDSRL